MKREPPKNKDQLRQIYQDIRKGISTKRREEARESLLAQLSDLIASDKVVLSYFPLSDEVDIGLVNQKLATRKGLSLPRMEEKEMYAYRVQNLEKDVERRNFGVYEPIAKKCELLDHIDVALIPGICFDKAKNRLGFGMGHYDRFLEKRNKIYKIGIAFKEQITDELIDVDNHDISMNQLCIV